MKLNRSIPEVLLSVFLLLPGGCASHREVGKDVEVPSGRHEAGSALNSDYLVHRGATLHTDFAEDCRIYVEAWGTFRGLGQGARKGTVYAEKGAKAERRAGVQYVQVADARMAFKERDKPTPITNSREEMDAQAPDVEEELQAEVAKAPRSKRKRRSLLKIFLDDYLFSGDDDDDDDGYHDRGRSDRSTTARVSRASYKKKE